MPLLDHIVYDDDLVLVDPRLIFEPSSENDELVEPVVDDPIVRYDTTLVRDEATGEIRLVSVPVTKSQQETEYQDYVFLDATVFEAQMIKTLDPNTVFKGTPLDKNVVKGYEDATIVHLTWIIPGKLPKRSHAYLLDWKLKTGPIQRTTNPEHERLARTTRPPSEPMFELFKYQPGKTWKLWMTGRVLRETNPQRYQEMYLPGEPKQWESYLETLTPRQREIFEAFLEEHPRLLPYTKKRMYVSLSRTDYFDQHHPQYILGSAAEYLVTLVIEKFLTPKIDPVTKEPEDLKDFDAGLCNKMIHDSLFDKAKKWRNKFDGPDLEGLDDADAAMVVREVQESLNIQPSLEVDGVEKRSSDLLTQRDQMPLDVGEASDHMWDWVALVAKEVVYKDYIRGGLIFDRVQKPHHGEVFSLCYGEDKSAKKVAAELDLPEKEVISIRKSAKKMFDTRVERDPQFKRKLHAMWDPRNTNDPMTQKFAEECTLAVMGAKPLPGADRLRTLWAELDDDYE
jgi:hypothetical protein